MTHHDVPTLFGHLGYLLLLSGMASRAFRVKTRPPATRWTIVLLCAAAGLLPVQGLAAVGYLRGVGSDLSMLTQLFLGCTLVHHLGGYELLGKDDRAALYRIVGVAGLVVYMTAGRYGPFNAYAWGFNETAAIVLLAPLSLWLWVRRPRAGIALLASVGAYNLEVLESTNVWDYLVDPWLAMYAWGSLVYDLSTTSLERVGWSAAGRGGAV